MCTSPRQYATANDILRVTRLVEYKSTAKEIIQLLQTHQVIAVDIKGKELPCGQIAFVTVATCDGCVFIFDLWNQEEIMQDGLRELLEDNNVLKVIFDASPVSQSLYDNYGVQICNVFDCKIAYYYIMNMSGEDCGACSIEEMEYLTLNFLDCQYGDCIGVPTYKTMQRLSDQDENFWYQRPCCMKVLEYAARDTVSLLPTIYNNLSSMLIQRMKYDEFKDCCDERIQRNGNDNQLQMQFHSLSERLACQQQQLQSVICELEKIRSQIMKEENNAKKCNNYSPPDCQISSECEKIRSQMMQEENNTKKCNNTSPPDCQISFRNINTNYNHEDKCNCKNPNPVEMKCRPRQNRKAPYSPRKSHCTSQKQCLKTSKQFSKTKSKECNSASNQETCPMNSYNCEADEDKTYAEYE